MSNLTSYVSTFDDINARISISIGFTLRSWSIREVADQTRNFIKSDDLNTALNDFFVSRNETALQDKYAKSIIEKILEDWLPTFKGIGSRMVELESLIYITGTGELKPRSEINLSDIEFVLISENIRELQDLYPTIENFLRKIINQIRQFSPDLYKQYKNEFSNYVRLKDIEIISIDKSKSLISADTTAKLQWKGDKTDLAELIWALYESDRIVDTSTGQPVTQKELASQFSTMLDLDSLDVVNLMKGRYGTKTKPTSYKAQEGKTFVAALQKLLETRISD